MRRIERLRREARERAAAEERAAMDEAFLAELERQLAATPGPDTVKPRKTQSLAAYAARAERARTGEPWKPPVKEPKPPLPFGRKRAYAPRPNARGKKRGPQYRPEVPITADNVRHLFTYYADNGAMWRNNRFGQRSYLLLSTVSDKRSSYVKHKVVTYQKKKYLVADIAWLWLTGEWPEEPVQYDNLETTDTRADNLRVNGLSYTAHLMQREMAPLVKSAEENAWRYEPLPPALTEPPPEVDLEELLGQLLDNGHK